MAAFRKFEDRPGYIMNILRHANRLIRHNRNPDIDPDRETDNYCLTPYVDAKASNKEIFEAEKIQFYKELSQLYIYNRPDVIKLVGCIITCPQELTDPAEKRKFFSGCVDFLSERYGHCISAHVHADEGGQDHLHYYFVPAVKIHQEKLKKKQQFDHRLLDFEEKLCANEVLTPRELKKFHPELNRYINDVVGIRCNLNSGITPKMGGNKTVDMLKRETAEATVKYLEEKVPSVIEKKNAKIKQLMAELEQAKQVNKEEKIMNNTTKELMKETIVSAGDGLAHSTDAAVNGTPEAAGTHLAAATTKTTIKATATAISASKDIVSSILNHKPVSKAATKSIAKNVDATIDVDL